MKQQIKTLLEGKKKELKMTNVDFYDNSSFNKGIDTAIESIDEIVEEIAKELNQMGTEEVWNWIRLNLLKE